MGRERTSWELRWIRAFRHKFWVRIDSAQEMKDAEVCLIMAADPSLPPVRLLSSRQVLFSRFRCKNTLFPLPFSGLYCLDPAFCRVREGDWLVSVDYAGSAAPLFLTEALRLCFLLHVPSLLLSDGLLLFPFGGEGGRLMLRCRKVQFYDSALTWWKERLCYALFCVISLLGVKNDSWLVYEKFCSRAEDNGYAFFSYCMQVLPEKKRRHIYYILDRKAGCWNEFHDAYGRQLVPFMSFRHIWLMLRSPLYVSSESKTHGYAWKAKPNPVIRQIRTGPHRILFLQHGVTALKRVDGIFGRHGTDPMTWFAVSSEAEQRIVTEHFGYQKEEVPILGFPRWDLLYDRASDRRVFLVLPTWRKWLEEQDRDTFMSSQYYLAYISLLRDQSLRQMLKETDSRLVFCLHPKFSPFMETFRDAEGMADDRVSLAVYGERPVKDWLEECSALVTDYSSVCWDAVYMGKPVLFYHFDQERYLEVTGSYLNLDTELPGEQYKTLEDLEEGMRKLAEADFIWQEDLRAKREAYFAFHDRDNCRRVYEFLENQENQKSG